MSRKPLLADTVSAKTLLNRYGTPKDGPILSGGYGCLSRSSRSTRNCLRSGTHIGDDVRLCCALEHDRRAAALCRHEEAMAA